MGLVELQEKMDSVKMPKRLQLFMLMFFHENPRREEEFYNYIYMCEHWKEILSLDYTIYKKEGKCQNRSCELDSQQSIHIIIKNLMDQEFSFCDNHMQNLISNLNNYAEI